jgi:cytochrome c556
MSADRRIERAQTAVGHGAFATAIVVFWALFGGAVFCGVLSGCGPAPSVPHPSVTGATPAAGATASGSKARESLADGERPVTVRTDAQGRKWLGDVPYDVFFDDPLAVATEGRTESRATSAPTAAQPNGKTSVASAEHTIGSSATPGATSPGDASSRPPNGAGTTSTGSAGTASGKAAVPSTNWSDLIDPDTLDAEVKRIRTELTAGLQSVGKYNAHYQEIAVAGSTLAALAEIVVELPRSSSWKEHAANVRDLAASIHDAAKALGGPAYQATKTPTDQMMDVLDGNLPAGLPAAEPMREFSQVANRSALMKRMDRSFQRLKKGGTAQQLLKNNATQALEDAAMLAVLSRVISVGHYDSADDPKYHAHAIDLTRGATDLATAAKSGEAPAFADALTRIQKRCDACHADFRF